MTALDDWDSIATVARLPLAGRSQLAVDTLDKRIYWAEQGSNGAALYRARYNQEASSERQSGFLRSGPSLRVSCFIGRLHGSTGRQWRRAVGMT